MNGLQDLDLYTGHTHADSMLEDTFEDDDDQKDPDMESGSSDLLLYHPILKRGGDSVYNATSQTAMIGVKYSPIESLDYEIMENDFLKQDWRSRTRVEILQYISVKWTMAFLIGLCTGLTGFFINMAVENIAGYKLLKTTYYLIEKRYLLSFSILIGSNMLLVLVGSALCTFVAPGAAGSGIPEVKAYLNGIDAPDILSPKTLLVKVLGSICAVAGGLDVGKEGPMVHIGACFASLFGQGGSKQYRLTWRWITYLKNDRDRRDLVTCGAAAGVAAAFRAPVGGVLFALEEATSWWRSSLLWRAFFCSATVAIVLRLAINFCESGKCGTFGTGGLIMFDMGIVSSDIGLMELIPVVILGLLGGFLGSLFTFINGKIVRAYSSWYTMHGSVAKLMLALLIAFVSSAFMFGIPWLGTCSACPDSLTTTESDDCPSTSWSGQYKQFNCPDGYYNDLAGLFLNTNDDIIRSLFSTNTSHVHLYSSLVMFFASSFVLALATYGTAIPSGLFIPVIITGAAYGRLAGKLMRSIGKLENLDEGVYAYLGAASLLGGSMRMTVSLCVILLELTNNLLMLPLTMLVLLISKTIGDLFNHSVYEQILQIKGLPFLEEKPEPYMKHLTVMDVCSRPVSTLSAIERVSTIVEILKSTDHNGFPVLEHAGESAEQRPVLCGLILRSHLLVLLKRGEFSSSQFCSSDFAKAGTGKGARIQDITLSPEQLEMYVDLLPYTNMSPYTVVENVSLAKAFSLFRQLGLRHLCIVPKNSAERSPIVGMLTRHDFMPEHVLGLHPHLKASKWNRLRVRPSMITTVTHWWS